MASSFLSTASKKVTDVRGFLRDAAGGSSIKYAAEKGTKHLLYIPFQSATEVAEDGSEITVKQLVAISGAVHEWQSPDGKYKATVCMKDVLIPIDEDDLSKGYKNDGTCPFCERVSDAWDVYRYRKELEEANCKLSGEDRKKHLEKSTSTFADERKAKDARTYMYIVIVKYRTQSDNSNSVVMGSDGLPEYDLKVMKLSNSRVEKIQQQIANSGSELPGAELMFEYPNTDDRRLQVSQSTTAPVFPNNMLTVKYPALVNKINSDVAKFEWAGIEKSFPEWSGMTSMEANKITLAQFEQWDKYKTDLQLNPGSRYMEYINDTPVTNPQLGGNIMPNVAAAIPSVIPNTVPSLPSVGDTNLFNAAPNGLGAPQIPSIPDANAVFGGAAPGIQI